MSDLDDNDFAIKAPYIQRILDLEGLVALQAEALNAILSARGYCDQHAHIDAAKEDCAAAWESAEGLVMEAASATAQAYEQEVEQRGAVKALEDAKADNGRGFSLWFTREEWGGIIDGLALEIERSGGRKNTNTESASDVRMTMCERIIAAINNACELRATSRKG